MKIIKLHSLYFFQLCLLFFVAISFSSLYKITIFWSLTLFVLTFFMGLNGKDALKIFFLTLLFSYSVFLLFLLFPGADYKAGERITVLGYTFYEKAFKYAIFTWSRLWAISLFSLASAKVLDSEELILYFMQKKIISKQLGYSLLMGLNAVSGFVTEWNIVSLNLKLRRIENKNPFKRIFPLLVYSFRVSLRGAMALRSRGLVETKTFYVEEKTTKYDFLLFCSILGVLFGELCWLKSL